MLSPERVAPLRSSFDVPLPMNEPIEPKGSTPNTNDVAIDAPLPLLSRVLLTYNCERFDDAFIAPPVNSPKALIGAGATWSANSIGLSETLCNKPRSIFAN